MYADYTYYTDTFCGTKITTEAEYNHLAIYADAFLDNATMHNIDTTKPYMDKVKTAECALCEQMQTEIKQNDGEASIVASESVGNHSVTYAVQAKTSEDYTRSNYALVRMLLSGTGLLYGGMHYGRLER